jgi:hypothetical protein
MSRRRPIDWATTEWEVPGHLTILFHDKRAYARMTRVLGHILKKRKPLIHKGGKP